MPAKQSLQVADAVFARARESLAKGDKKARPRKLTTLKKHLKSILSGKASDEQVAQVVERLIKEKIVHASGEAVNYPD